MFTQNINHQTGDRRWTQPSHRCSRASVWMCPRLLDLCTPPISKTYTGTNWLRALSSLIRRPHSEQCLLSHTVFANLTLLFCFHRSSGPCKIYSSDPLLTSRARSAVTTRTESTSWIPLHHTVDYSTSWLRGSVSMVNRLLSYLPTCLWSPFWSIGDPETACRRREIWTRKRSRRCSSKRCHRLRITNPKALWAWRSTWPSHLTNLPSTLRYFSRAGSEALLVCIRQYPLRSKSDMHVPG